MNVASRKLKLQNLFYALRKYFYGTSSHSRKMVRYFTNNHEDYKPGSVLTIGKDEISLQIAEHVHNNIKRLQPLSKNVDGGIYVGVTGIAYMFYYLSKNPLLSENKRIYITKGLQYLKPALESSAGDKTSFLLGDAGTYVIATALYREAGDEKYMETLSMYRSLYSAYLDPNFLKCGSDEYFVGRTGYLCGALWLSRELQTTVISNEDMYKICDVIIASGKEFAKKHNSPCPLMYHYYNTQYLGAAHGISIILQILITVPGYLQHNESAAQDIKATIDYVTSLQTDEGNWPCCMEEVGMNEHKLVHWCHGAPGVIYLMAKAYLVYKDQVYYNACLRAGEVVWAQGLLRKGPGLCHGVAGNGYVFLLLYRLTGDKKYLYRAKVFADFMNSDDFQQDARVPDNPESLYEGTAGTVCFLADLLVPNSAEFPFQDVFN